MTKSHNVKNDSVDVCPSTDPGNSSSIDPVIQVRFVKKQTKILILLQKGEFDWSPKTQGYVLASFFYGYVLTQVLGGILAERFGGKWIFGGSILVAGLLTLVTPFAARLHVDFLIFIRLLIGAFEV